jgi:hypothetical protein
MAVVLSFYASDGFTFFFPGMELHFSDDKAIPEENISCVGVVKGEYHVSNLLILGSFLDWFDPFDVRDRALQEFVVKRVLSNLCQQCHV